MENENICVFCGEKLSRFRSTTIPCGHTLRPVCKSCGKYEFFEPTVVRKNKYLAYLIWKDTHD